ncbi:MAG: hypothetical protein HY819_08270 [Acidobacteria bacterium]|nr:hypothetical protein [Acidobacteriota bacterium]
MKYNSLSLLGTLVFTFFILFSPNVFAQEINSKTESAMIVDNSSTLEKVEKVEKIEDYLNKYLEVKLVNGKKVAGKLVEYKNETLTLKEGLIKKQVAMSNVVSFEIVRSPGEKIKDTLEDVEYFTAVYIMAPPVELILHAFNLGCIGD